ncbi:hypothetical protein [Candidatus Uabimicrobium amorphum]|uniref:Flagellar protein FliT n=1 Tax=Uabimicrobium amorphum TaxID=2596890 RepID=A0A5S9F3R1_UABAM|nr:hypothetical protein [Candidatus Uabimicrobium amorphum]BBM84997.1 hypothetical protein UABAM_03360 [Candidatus Uabimicrobium amorphum]
MCEEIKDYESLLQASESLWQAVKANQNEDVASLLTTKVKIQQDIQEKYADSPTDNEEVIAIIKRIVNIDKETITQAQLSQRSIIDNLKMLLEVKKARYGYFMKTSGSTLDKSV